jgi:hypothetical protein
MSAESDKAGRIAAKGLDLIDKILDELATVPRDDWGKTHVRDVTDCVQAAVRFQAEERAQLDFEKEAKLAPEDIRAAMIEWLRGLPASEKQALMAEAGLVPPGAVTQPQEAQPHA